MRLLRVVLVAPIVLALALGASAHAAAYLKIGDIKGEASEAAMRRGWVEIATIVWEPTASNERRQGWITLDRDPVAIGLLLPAVQKVRDAASAPPRSRVAPIVTYRETSGGRILRTEWLENVTFRPAESARGAATNRIRVS